MEQKSFFEKEDKITINNLMFLDTETTGIDEDARLVQLAYKLKDSKELVNELFKPPVEISIMSMSVCHITNKDVENKPSFIGSVYYDKLQERLEDYILVAHNAKFDIKILNNEGLSVNKFIDTLRLSKHLLTFDSYKLQYLRYALGMEIKATAHDALGDILVLEQLFDYLLENMKIRYSELDEKGILDKMIELTNTPVLLNIVPYGKYRGQSFEDVSMKDPSYLDWMYRTEISREEPDQREDLIFTLKEYV